MSEARSHTSRVEALLAEADWVQRIALHLGVDAATSDDLMQETWLAALRQASPPGVSLRAWLAGITRNLARMHWRTESRRKRREETHAVSREPPPSPASVVERMELQRHLADAILRLDEPYRQTVALRYLDGLSSAEIARRENVPAATVRGRLKRALELLRADLDERYGGDRRTWLVALLPFVPAPPTPPGWIHQTAGRIRAMPPSTHVLLVAALVLATVGTYVAFDVLPAGAPGAPPAAPPAEPDAGPPAPAEPAPPEPEPPVPPPSAESPPAAPPVEAGPVLAPDEPDDTEEPPPPAPPLPPEEVPPPPIVELPPEEATPVAAPEPPTVPAPPESPPPPARRSRSASREREHRPAWRTFRRVQP